MRLEDFKVYQVSMEIGEEVYNLAGRWEYFDRKTLGMQIVRAADSIAANISEGYGRYSYKETKVFLYYARGSAQETRTWITKAGNRNLITAAEAKILCSKMDFCLAMINGLTKSIGPTSWPT
jgi:four helix bundle protein